MVDDHVLQELRVNIAHRHYRQPLFGFGFGLGFGFGIFIPFFMGWIPSISLSSCME